MSVPRKRQASDAMGEATPQAAAVELTDVLRRTDRRIVFAESCTAGLASSMLADIPGVSEHHCGSAVVYRNGTKHAWLGVPAALLDDPAIGPVSREAAESMATGVLRTTPEADLAAAITGHLGPGAPVELDGVVHIALAERGPTPSDAIRISLHKRIQLRAAHDDPQTLRSRRRIEAAQLLLEAAATVAGRPAG